MIKGLVRNGAKVRSCMKELPDGRLLCTQNLKIHIPARFADIGLAQISTEITIYGICALILPDNTYSVMLINAMMNITPYKILKQDILGVDYYEFYFKANEPWLKSTSLVKQGSTMYTLINELDFNGKVPWYINYEDKGKILDTAAEHAGSNLGKNHAINETLASIVSRNPANKQMYFRHMLKDKKLEHPDYVPLDSVFYSTKPTLNKIAGSYFKDGIVSALANPSETSSTVDRLLRR